MEVIGNSAYLELENNEEYLRMMPYAEGLLMETDSADSMFVIDKSLEKDNLIYEAFKRLIMEITGNYYFGSGCNNKAISIDQAKKMIIIKTDKTEGDYLKIFYEEEVDSERIVFKFETKELIQGNRRVFLDYNGCLLYDYKSFANLYQAVRNIAEKGVQRRAG